MSKQEIREEFRKIVYGRDSHTCVVPGCGEPAVDAHHIMERSLWKELFELGGYLPDNGVSVCAMHHLHAEVDWIPPQALRFWAKIKNVALPLQLDPSKTYTKWGVEVKQPTRNSWENVKYPHTPYAVNSPSADEMDVRETGYSPMSCFVNKPCIATLKLDGSNALIGAEDVCARNGVHAEHKSYDLLKSQHKGIAHLIPKGVQVHGEWCFAKHSIEYKDELALGSYFYVFAVYFRDYHLWLGWDGVEWWAERLGFPIIPVLDKFCLESEGEVYDRFDKIGNKVIADGHEGIVIRSTYPFYYGQFRDNVAKWVRPNHVQTDVHWSRQKIVRNEVK